MICMTYRVQMQKANPFLKINGNMVSGWGSDQIIGNCPKSRNVLNNQIWNLEFKLKPRIWNCENFWHPNSGFEKSQNLGLQILKSLYYSI